MKWRPYSHFWTCLSVYIRYLLCSSWGLQALALPAVCAVCIRGNSSGTCLLIKIKKVVNWWLQWNDSAVNFLPFLLVYSLLFFLVRCGFPPWSLPGVNAVSLLSVVVCVLQILWANAFWLCRRNVAACLWLYLFGLCVIQSSSPLPKAWLDT